MTMSFDTDEIPQVEDEIVASADPGDETDEELDEEIEEKEEED